MARIIIIDEGDEQDAFLQLLGRMRRPQGALTGIGAYLTAKSDEAFEEQRFGDALWPERYEGGPEPYVNVAGALRDFKEGADAPKDRRFDRRPVLADTGELRRSIAWQTLGDDMVEVGSALPYAKLHHEGGESTIDYDRATKARLWGWLKKQPKPMKRRLGWLLNKTIWQLDTKVHRRPFVGVTRDMREDLVEIVEDFLAEG